MQHNPETPEPKPKGKPGRPKGSKNRPKWLLDQLRKAPKRPVGRPKGAKALPKSLDELIVHSLQKPEPAKAEVKVYDHPKRLVGLAKLKWENPEKFREHQRRAANSEARMKAPRTPAGIPAGWTNMQWALAKDAARKIAHRIYKNMDIEGALPENPIAREAMKTALEMLAEDNATRDRLAIVRTLLEFTHSKPASTQNVNLKTAEDFLDELAAEEK